MQPASLARIFTAALLICATALAIGLLGSGAMVAANTAPRFSYQINIADAAGLEIHNGSACPRDMPIPVCYASSLAYRREFRIVYRANGYRHPLLSIRLPDRRGRPLARPKS